MFGSLCRRAIVLYSRKETKRFRGLILSLRRDKHRNDVYYSYYKFQNHVLSRYVSLMPLARKQKHPRSENYKKLNYWVFFRRHNTRLPLLSEGLY